MSSSIRMLLADLPLAITASLTLGVVCYFGVQALYRALLLRADQRKREKIRRQFWGYE